MIAGASAQPARGFSASSWAFAAFLAFMIVLGGSVRGAFAQAAVLEILACLALIWCLIDERLRPISRSAFWLILLVTAGIGICLLQLVPLPYDWWSVLPGRLSVREVFDVSDIGPVDQPLSLAPDNTLYGVLRILPPLGLLVVAAKLPWRFMSDRLAWVVVLLAVCSGLLALAQTFAGSASFLFPFGVKNHGQAPGIFEIVNHQATLQLMAVPFIALLFGDLKQKFDDGDAYQAMAIGSVTALVLVTTGLFLAGSVAGYALAVPAGLVSCALAMDRRPGPLTIISLGLVALGVAALAYVALTSPLLKGLGVTDLGSGGLSRRELYRGTIDMIREYWPAGAGLGAFETAYPAYESPVLISGNYVSHAHNDYMETIAEFGLPGCFLLIGLVVWWGIMTVRVWTAPRELGGPLKRAASIAAGIVLVHSLLDSPARTEAISCLTALCLGIMSSNYSRGRAGAGRPDYVHQTFAHRHIEL